MGLFTKRQSDETWLAEVKPSIDAAVPHMLALDEALDNESFQDQFTAVQYLSEYLPLVKNSFGQIRGPSSAEAQKMHKSFKSALSKYVDGSKAGLNFFKDLGGGPGQRAANETGMANRAALGRLAFSETFFKEIAKTGREHMDVVNAYLRDAATN